MLSLTAIGCFGLTWEPSYKMGPRKECCLLCELMRSVNHLCAKKCLALFTAEMQSMDFFSKELYFSVSNLHNFWKTFSGKGLRGKSIILPFCSYST